MARTKADANSIKRGTFFAKRVKSSRESQQLTQRELSDRSGISLDTLRSIENEKTLSPGLFVAADIIRALGESIDDWVDDISNLK